MPGKINRGDLLCYHFQYYCKNDAMPITVVRE